MRGQEDRGQEDRGQEDQSSGLDSTRVAVGTERRAQAASEQPVPRLSPLPPQTEGKSTCQTASLHQNSDAQHR